MKTYLILLSISILSLTACGQSKSLDYYKSHLKEAREYLKTCPIEPKPNTTQAKNCKNANDAILQEEAKGEIKSDF